MTRMLDITTRISSTVNKDCRKSGMRYVRTCFTNHSRRHILSIGPGLLGGACL